MDSRTADIQTILSHRADNEGDFWATPDGRIYTGHPFSTLGALGMLYELGVEAGHEAVQGGLELIVNACREDGRIQLAPNAPLYPCYTAEAARVMCRYGMTNDENLQRTIPYLLENTHETGGWRCSFTKLGKGPETKFSNPGATLFALDVLRFFPKYGEGVEVVDHAVESLLSHWETRAPIGPCQYGMGTLFMQVEFPFLRYNLFYYIYVLSFFTRAKADIRFGHALAALEAKLSENGEVIIERPHRALKGLDFCERGVPSALATVHYREIQENLRH